MSRLTLKIANKQLCNYYTFFVKNIWGKEFCIYVSRTKQHKLTIKDINGKSFDKCSMSNWFKSYDYYAIYWDSARKDDMIATIINELREELYNVTNYEN